MPLSINATGRLLTLPLLRSKSGAPSKQPVAAQNPSDEELVERIQGRDQTALLMLFRRYGKLTHSIARRIVGDEGEAEDLVQDIFLRLHEGNCTFDASKGNARTWFVQMVYRRSFDRRGYLARRHFYTGTGIDEQTNAPTGGRNLEDDVIDRLTAQQLRTAFDRIRVRQRETLELFFFEGLTLAEIAERLGEDVRNTRHHYYRGLERLRQTAREMLLSGKGAQ